MGGGPMASEKQRAQLSNSQSLILRLNLMFQPFSLLQSDRDASEFGAIVNNVGYWFFGKKSPIAGGTR